MTGVAIVLEGRDHADATLGRALAALDDATPMFDQIGRAMVASTQRRFETETGPAGNPWPPSLRALLTGSKTLTDTSRLRNSMTHEPAADQVAWGTNDIRAAIHQRGGTIRARTAKGLRFRPAGGGASAGIGNEGFVIVQSVTMPARPFLGVDDSDERAIERIAGEYLAEALAASAGGTNAG